MPYLPPTQVLDRLSTFTADSVMGYVGEESSFARSQIGSMSSTLGFLSNEVEGRDDAAIVQYDALLELCDTLESLGTEEAATVVNEQRDRLQAVDTTVGNTRSVEEIVLEVFDDLRQAVSDGVFGSETPEARSALYDSFEVRIDAQLQMVGKSE